MGWPSQGRAETSKIELQALGSFWEWQQRGGGVGGRETGSDGRTGHRVVNHIPLATGLFLEGKVGHIVREKLKDVEGKAKN